MNLLKYIILGIIQGITEPLPISSSGHIFLLKTLFKLNMFNDLNLEIILNFASLLAIIVIFRKDIIKLVKDFIMYLIKPNKKYHQGFIYSCLIILGTIPVVVIGLIFKNPLEKLLSQNIYLVGFGFIITAIALIATTYASGTKEDKDITWRDALIIGLCQSLAIAPGISRSGMTLVGCLLCGLSKKTSLKYTFMLYIPVSIGSLILGLNDISLPSNLIFSYILASIFALLGTLLSYKFLTSVVEKSKLWYFSIYLLVVGLFTIIIFL